MLSLSRELLGKSIGGYHLTRLIGIGGTGAVFLGNGDDGGEMAVKILIPPILISEESLKEFHKRFQREAEILSQLDHPYILPVKDFGTDTSSGYPYMIMPYKSGGTLVEQIQAGPLPFDRAMKYVWQLAKALNHAHHQNIIHRDIKPANVLLDEEDQVSLADFSIAKLFNLSTTTLTSANQMLGTPAYMAPEQVSNKTISPATDIYGLGVLTYQLLTGSLPFDVSTLLALLQRIMLENPPQPHGIRTDLPPAASEVLFKSLAKDPEERFASAEDFALALEQSMQSVLTTSAIMLAAKEKWSPVEQSDDSEPRVDGTVATDETDKAVTSNDDPILNDPTLVAYYATSPLEDDQASRPSATNNMASGPLVAQNPAPAQKNNRSTSPTIADRHAFTQKEASVKFASYRVVPLSKEQEQEDNKQEGQEEASPIKDDVAPLEEQLEEQPEEQKTLQPAPLPAETVPMATEQQESILPAKDEEVGPLVTVLAFNPSLSSLLPSEALDAALISTAPLLPEKSVVNLPTGRHATIIKKSSRFQLSLKKPWPRWQIILAAVLTILLISEGTFSLYASGHGLFVHQNTIKPTPTSLPPARLAVIGITPDSQKLQKTFTIAAVTGLPDANQHQVLARWIYNTTLPQQRTVGTTGKVATPAASASGTLLFTNSSSTGAITIPAGSIIISKGMKKTSQVVLDEAVNIPPAPLNYVNPNQRPMQRVRAHYATSGAAGNIGAQQFSFVSGACVPANPVCYSAFNDAPFIGGTDAQNYTFVQQGDIDGASRALQTLGPDPQVFLKGQLSSSEQWIITPSCKPQTASDHAVNDKVARVTVTVTFSCSGEAYDQKGALEAAKQELKALAAKNPGGDYMLSGNINATLQNAQIVDSNGTVNLTVDTKGMWVFQLNDAKKQDLAKTMVGKKKPAVQHMLKGLKGIKDATIDLQDGDENTFPDDPQEITIHTQPVI